MSGRVLKIVLSSSGANYVLWTHLVLRHSSTLINTRKKLMEAPWEHLDDTTSTYDSSRPCSVRYYLCFHQLTLHFISNSVIHVHVLYPQSSEFFLVLYMYLLLMYCNSPLSSLEALKQQATSFFSFFLTAHSPDNTFLGFVVNAQTPTITAKKARRKAKALVYGKHYNMWKVLGLSFALLLSIWHDGFKP